LQPRGAGVDDSILFAMSGTPDEIDLAEHIAMMPKMAISTIPKGVKFM
jgi:hypothetical protein